eukprot:1998901-Amphidinium_carterae.1
MSTLLLTPVIVSTVGLHIYAVGKLDAFKLASMLAAAAGASAGSSAVPAKRGPGCWSQCWQLLAVPAERELGCWSRCWQLLVVPAKGEPGCWSQCWQLLAVPAKRELGFQERKRRFKRWLIKFQILRRTSLPQTVCSQYPDNAVVVATNVAPE